MSLAVLADHMASKGRNGDTMLVHMTPEEVRGLHALAMAHGGSLSINPETGLPEANFLKKLLPTIIGAGISFFSGGTIDPMTAAMIVGGVETARTGDLGKGIAAGFGAYGGANLTSALSSTGAEAIGSQAVSDAGREAILAKAAQLGGEQGLSTVALTEQAAKEALAKEAIAKATPFDRLSTGISGLMEKGGRDAFMKEIGGVKGLSRAGLGILAGSSLAADKSLQASMPQTTTKFAVRDFDPYGGYFTTRPTIYGASGGLMGMAEGGMANTAEDSFSRGGMFDFAQRSEPVVRMADGGMTPNPFAQQIAEGQKAIPYAQGTAATARDIADIYQSVLGRAPDEGGLAFYQASQFSPDQIRADIMKSPEAQAFMASQKTQSVSPQAPLTHAQLGAQAIPYAQGVAATEADINQIYRDMLGRTPDEGGFQFYKASQFSPEQIRAEIAKSQEYLTRPFTPEVPTMDEVRSDYEAGGGGTQMRSVNTPEPGAQVMTQNKVVDTLQGYLAANPNATIEQIQAWGRANGIPSAQLAAAINERRFSQMTGGSLQAYDYLMGRGAYPTRPFTLTGELMRPYAEAVLGAPENRRTKRLIFDPATRTYKPNPDYVERKSAVETAPIRDAGGNAVSMSSVTETYFRANPDVRAAWQAGNTGMSADDYAKFHYTTMGRFENPPRTGWTGPTPSSTSGGGDTQVSGGKAGGLMNIAAAAARGGNVGQYDLGSYSDGGRLLRGPGDGVSDSIPATIGGKRPARLADGEFVVPARIVSEIGNGSTEAGARKLYAMMDRVQRARAKTTGKGKVAKNTRADKYLPA